MEPIRCPHPGCAKTFKNKRGIAGHVRFAHGENSATPKRGVAAAIETLPERGRARDPRDAFLIEIESLWGAEHVLG